MTTDFRALCAELADELHDFQWAVQEAGVGWACPDTESLIDRARAALADPEPKGPSDEDVEAAAQRIYEAMRFERVEATPVWSENGNSFAQDAAREAARAVLARWGRPAPQPVPVSERLPDNRDPECVANWPECWSGGYDPRCCRFPKSCSCERGALPLPVEVEG